MLEQKTQVLIIGSGGAGLSCAIALKEEGFEDILVVSDRRTDDAHTSLAAGGISAALATMDKEDSWEIHAVDTFREAQGIANPTLVETLAKKSPEAIQDLINLGAKFHTEEDGSLTQRFFGAHTYRRTVFSGDHTGKEIVRVLMGKAQELQIPFKENTYIFKLLVEDGKVKGALGVEDEEVMTFKAPVVVLASGGYSNLFNRSSSRNKENFGNAISMVLQEGGTIGDIEMVQFHPTGLVYPTQYAGTMVTEAVRAEGGILKNSFGERFMKRYDPDRLELSTRDIVARANFTEIMTGSGTINGGVYLDITSRTKDYLLDRLPDIYEQMKKFNGIDISKEPIEVAPTAHYSMGGIYFDPETQQTTINGLYAVGECTMGTHGANRLGGNSLAEILIFGKSLGKKLAGTKIEDNFSSSLYKAIERYTSDFINVDGEIYGSDFMREIRSTMWRKVGIIRTGLEMQEAQAKFKSIREQIKAEGVVNRSTIKDNIIHKTKLMALLDLAEAVTTAALVRQESRGAHYRTDYNHPSDKYLINILIKRKKDSLQIEKRPVPKVSTELAKAIEKYDKSPVYTQLE